ncbi:unannotated protein [freshwater metagenome]
MSLAFMLVCLVNGGNDIIATQFNLTINGIMWFTRIGLFVIPPIVFVITKRLCLSLQRADRDLVLHGRETGRLVMTAEGEFVEVHEPLSAEKIYTLTQHEQNAPLALPDVDANGVRGVGGMKGKLRKRASIAAAEQVPSPTLTEAKEIEHH